MLYCTSNVWYNTYYVNVEATWTHTGPGGGTRRLHHKHLENEMSDIVTYLLLRLVQYGLVIVAFGSLLEVFMMGSK